MVWIQMLRREFLIANNIYFYDGILFEDNLFTFHVLMNAERVYCINDILYYKRIRADSIVTRSECIENIEGFLITLIEELNYLNNYHNSSKDLNKALFTIIKQIVKQIHKRFNRLPESQKNTLFDKCTVKEYVMLRSILELAEGELYTN